MVGFPCMFSCVHYIDYALEESVYSVYIQHNIDYASEESVGCVGRQPGLPSSCQR